MRIVSKMDLSIANATFVAKLAPYEQYLKEGREFYVKTGRDSAGYGPVLCFGISQDGEEPTLQTVFGLTPREILQNYRNHFTGTRTVEILRRNRAGATCFRTDLKEALKFLDDHHDVWSVRITDLFESHDKIELSRGYRYEFTDEDGEVAEHTGDEFDSEFAQLLIEAIITDEPFTLTRVTREKVMEL